MILSKEKLLEYNLAGLIPGPEENEDAFAERADYCLNLKNQIPQMLAHELPFSAKESQASEEVLKAGCEKAYHLYAIFPQWVPLFFSNYKLPFWQGGCAWIFQQKQDSPTSAFFQLRQKFLTSKNYLGLYDRDELIAHELSHVGRMMFEEPKFEEILAYRSSNSSLRKFLGPIIQSSYESTLFVLAISMLIAIDIFSITSHVNGISYLSFFLRSIVLGMIGFGLLRVCWRQRQFQTCLENIKNCLSDPKQAEAVIYRLTDKEIVNIGSMTPDQILHYADEQRAQNLRWILIHTAYFQSKNST
jgi:hypothetical protein